MDAAVSIQHIFDDTTLQRDFKQKLKIDKDRPH